MSPKLIAHIATKTALLLPLMAQGATEAISAPQARSGSIEVEVTELSPTVSPNKLVARSDFSNSDFGDRRRTNSDSRNQSDSGNQFIFSNDFDFG